MVSVELHFADEELDFLYQLFIFFHFLRDISFCLSLYVLLFEKIKRILHSHNEIEVIVFVNNIDEGATAVFYGALK